MAEIRIAVSLGGWSNDDTDAVADLVEIAVPIPDRVVSNAYEYRALVAEAAIRTVEIVDAVRKPVEPVADVHDEIVTTVANNFYSEEKAA